MIYKFRKFISENNKKMMVYSENTAHAHYFSITDRRAGIMQSTGIYDVQVKEIYEQDIVKIEEEFYGIVWDYHYAQFALLKKFVLHREQNSMLRQAIIYGNAYENPDLIHLIY